MFDKFIRKRLGPSRHHVPLMIKINYDFFFKIQYPQRIAIINVIAKKPGTGVGVRGTGGDVTGGDVTGGDVTDGGVTGGDVTDGVFGSLSRVFPFLRSLPQPYLDQIEMFFPHLRIPLVSNGVCAPP